MVVGLMLVWLVIKNPDWGLAILVFVIYTRFSDILEHESGVPSFVLPLALLVVVAVGDAGAGEQAARMIERREAIKVVRSIRELYCLKVTSPTPTGCFAKVAVT